MLIGFRLSKSSFSHQELELYRKEPGSEPEPFEYREPESLRNPYLN